MQKKNTKKPGKKLKLKRETVRALTPKDLKEVAGGAIICSFSNADCDER